MTPLGHAAFSLCTQRVVRRGSAAGWVFGGVFVDVDFLLFFTPAFNSLHRVVTHNLLFVSVTAFAVALLRRRSPGAVGLACSVFAGGLGHLLVDSMLDGNPSNGIGVALFWPWSDECWSPFNLVRVSPNPPSWNEPLAMAKAIVRSLWVEVPFYLWAAWLCWGRRGWKNSRIKP